MPGWSRRDVLAALAAAGVAPVWAPLLSGCHRSGGRGASHPSAASEPRPVGELRDDLRRVVRRLEQSFTRVEGRARVVRRRVASADPAESGVSGRARATAVLAGFDGAGWFEEATSDVSQGGLTAAAERLLDRAGLGGTSPGGSRSATRSAGPQDRDGAGGAAIAPSPMTAPHLHIDPRTRPDGALMDAARQLYQRARGIASSRLVFRAAAIEVEDTDHLFIDPARDVAQRRVSTRARVLFMAWAGSHIAAEQAERAGAMGLEAARLPAADLQAAARGALSLLTTGDLSAGERDVVLDPSLAALFIRHGVARGLESDAWLEGDARAAQLVGRRVAPAAFTLRDDPAAAGAYGGYRFDDEGWPAAPHALIDRGAVGMPLTDQAGAALLGLARTGHGRRLWMLAPARPRPSHLVLAPGTRAPDRVLDGIESGLLLEGGIVGRGDPRSWRVALTARRAREVSHGRLTGRVYGPVVLAGEVPAMLAAVRGLGRATRVFGWREEGGERGDRAGRTIAAASGAEGVSEGEGEGQGQGGIAVSASAPHLVSRAWVGPG